MVAVQREYSTRERVSIYQYKDKMVKSMTTKCYCDVVSGCRDVHQCCKTTQKEEALSIVASDKRHLL